MTPVAAGDVLADKYRVERVLGAGGMGVVVAAMHLELQELVAVKFLHPEAIESPEAAARFLREARVAVKIRSENVARVIDVGRLDNGAPYMVMEYLEGEDLAARILRGPLPVEVAVDYVIQACSAMVEAHKVGVVHRDLKPANLYIVERSDGAQIVKVLDFGISKLSVPDLSDAGLTKTSTMMGSPYYMSPEQMRSARDVDVRTDVWALGVIMFELLTAENAFGGTSLPELIANIMTVGPRPLNQLNPKVPEGLCKVVYRCLQKEPADRFQNVADLAQALAHFAGRDAQITVERLSRVAGVAPMLQRTANSSSTVPGPALGATNTSWSETKKTSGTRRPLLVGGALALAALGAAAWFVSRAPTVADTAPSAEPAKLAAAPAAMTAVDAPKASAKTERDATQDAAGEVTAAPALVEESQAVAEPAAVAKPTPPAAAPRAKKTTGSPKPATERKAEPAPTPAPPPTPEKKQTSPLKNPLNIELK